MALVDNHHFDWTNEIARSNGHFRAPHLKRKTDKKNDQIGMEFVW